MTEQLYPSWKNMHPSDNYLWLVENAPSTWRLCSFHVSPETEIWKYMIIYVLPWSLMRQFHHSSTVKRFAIYHILVFTVRLTLAYFLHATNLTKTNIDRFSRLRWYQMCASFPVTRIHPSPLFYGFILWIHLHLIDICSRFETPYLAFPSSYIQQILV